MIKTALFFSFLIFVVSVNASPIQYADCDGIIHGTVYDLSGHRVPSIRVIAFPVGVALGVQLPREKTDKNGEYRFEHICHGKYTVFVEDPEAGYPHASPEENEFLYVTPMKTLRLSRYHERAEFPVYMPQKPGILLVRIHGSQTKSEILEFAVNLSIPKQRKPNWESLYFSEEMTSREFSVPPGREFVLRVDAEGYKELSKRISVASGAMESIDLSLEPAD